MSSPGSNTAWARWMDRADELETAAVASRRHALELRCNVTDSGGARCTADGHEKHKHRYDRNDMPRKARIDE